MTSARFGVTIFYFKANASTEVLCVYQQSIDQNFTERSFGNKKLSKLRNDRYYVRFIEALI